METPELSPPSEEYQPTSKQLRRDKKMRRFNRLFVYLPIAIISSLVVLTILILSIYVLSSDPQDYVSGLSAIADSVVIIILIGLMIPMALSLGYGILFATAITLVLIPALYMIVEGWREHIGGGAGTPRGEPM